jgi:hypothetical protein
LFCVWTAWPGVAKGGGALAWRWEIRLQVSGIGERVDRGGYWKVVTVMVAVTKKRAVSLAATPVLAILTCDDGSRGPSW